MDTSAGHVSVLLREAIEALLPRSAGRYLDGTFGGGGHTRAILTASAPDGRVLALDADPAAIERGRALQAAVGDRLVLREGNFAGLAGFAREAGFAPLDGILLDLGLSS
jgi:16S rRNA (cytosine1402-N4)-methyltransferase